MFKWFYENSIEVDVPLQKVWDFTCNPRNSLQWVDQYESCKMDGDLKAGATVNAKIKNSTITLPILITELIPFNRMEYRIKVPLFTQISSYTFQEISSERTRVTLKACVSSILIPFFKGYCTRKLDRTNAKWLEALLKIEPSLENLEC